MVKEITLTQSKVALVDDEDYQDVAKFNWHLHKDGKGGMYARRWDRMLMHRFILEAPKGMQIDHINNDGLDNRRCNLRFATYSQNQINSAKEMGKSSIFKGVHWNKGMKKWGANINVDGKALRLGFFSNEIDAAKAYDRAALNNYGEFAVLNFKLGGQPPKRDSCTKGEVKE